MNKEKIKELVEIFADLSQNEMIFEPENPIFDEVNEFTLYDFYELQAEAEKQGIAVEYQKDKLLILKLK